MTRHGKTLDVGPIKCRFTATKKNRSTPVLSPLVLSRLVLSSCLAKSCLGMSPSVCSIVKTEFVFVFLCYHHFRPRFTQIKSNQNKY